MQIYRVYDDFKVDKEKAVLMEFGCGTGLGVLCAKLSGFKNIIASDVNLGPITEALNSYPVCYNSHYFGDIKVDLPDPRTHDSFYVKHSVDVGKARYVAKY